MSTVGFGTVGTAAGGGAAEYAVRRWAPGTVAGLKHLEKADSLVANFEQARRTELNNVAEVISLLEYANELRNKRNAALEAVRKALPQTDIDWQSMLKVSAPNQITAEHLQASKALEKALVGGYRAEVTRLTRSGFPAPWHFKTFHDDIQRIATTTSDPKEQARLFEDLKRRLWSQRELRDLAEDIGRWLSRQNIYLYKASFPEVQNAVASAAGQYDRFTKLWNAADALTDAASAESQFRELFTSVRDKIKSMWPKVMGGQMLTEGDLPNVLETFKGYQRSLKEVPRPDTSRPSMRALATTPATVASERRSQKITLPDIASEPLQAAAKQVEEWISGWDEVGKKPPLNRKVRWGAPAGGAAIGLGLGLGLDYLIRKWVEQSRREVDTPGGRE